jgi:hypothetical protein
VLRVRPHARPGCGDAYPQDLSPQPSSVLEDKCLNRVFPQEPLPELLGDTWWGAWVRLWKEEVGSRDWKGAGREWEAELAPGRCLL